MADRAPQRIDYPTSSMATGELGSWLQRLTIAVNQIPTFSFTSYNGGPNSNVTGAPGDLATNIVSSADTGRLYVKQIGSGNTGWRRALTVSPAVLDAGTAAVGGAPLYFTSGPLLTTPAEGAVEFENHVFYATTYLVRRSIALTQSIATVDVASGNTVLAKTFYSIPMAANFPVVGKMVLPNLFGTYSTHNAAVTFTVALKHSTTTILAVQSTAAAKTDEPWHARFVVTFRSVGTTGKFVAFGEVDANSSADASTTAEQAIDTTVDNTLNVTIAYDTANAGSRITLHQAYTESLG